MTTFTPVTHWMSLPLDAMSSWSEDVLAVQIEDAEARERASRG